jgi:hypothetical protein
VSLLVVEPLVEPVPLAPMLDVPLLLSVVAVLLDELGLVVLLLEDELLGVVVPLAPIEPCVLLASCVDDALVPPPPEDDEPDEPPVCAIAMPPMASAAAAANVVSVFLVVVMSFAP